MGGLRHVPVRGVSAPQLIQRLECYAAVRRRGAEGERRGSRLDPIFELSPLCAQVLGVEHQLAFTLPASGERVLAVALSRGGEDYSDAQRDLVDRARPFLIQAYLNALAFESLRASRSENDATPAIESLRASAG